MKETVINSGGMLVALWVCHLIGDWMFQTYEVAHKKTSDHRVRAWHCLLYCVPMGTLIFLLSPLPTFVLVMAWVFATHFVIDTYLPLYYFRQVMGDPTAKDIESFKSEFKTPSGFYINVTLDQIFHLITLVPVAVILATQ